MNERILQLAADAKIMTEESINMKISFNTQLKAFAEIFAELLIQECADIADTNDCNLSLNGDSIRMHFGVKE